MAHTERSSQQSYCDYPDQKAYDEAYHKIILPWVTGDVLDVGCGAGLLTVQIAVKPEVTSVVAIDKFLDDAPEHPKIRYVKGDLTESIPIMGEFDTIVSTEFIEHIPRESLDFILEDVKPRLRQGGVFCGSTPHVFQQSDNPFHIYEYNADELEGILKVHFTNVEVQVVNNDCAIWRVW